MVGIALRVALPDADRMGHQLPHRRLEIVVADDAAGDARRPRTDLAFVENDDVAILRPSLRGHLGGQMVGGRQAMNPGSDDDEASFCWKRHRWLLGGRTAASSQSDRLRKTTFATPPTANATAFSC